MRAPREDRPTSGEATVESSSLGYGGMTLGRMITRRRLLQDTGGVSRERA